MRVNTFGDDHKAKNGVGFQETAILAEYRKAQELESPVADKIRSANPDLTTQFDRIDNELKPVV